MMAAGKPLLQQVAVHGVPTLVMLPGARRVKVIWWGNPRAQHRVRATMKPCPLKQSWIDICHEFTKKKLHYLS